MTNKDLASVILALLSAFFVYQFGRRSKSNDSFLEQLTKSYEDIYYPMYMMLRNIKATSIERRELLLVDFFKAYSSSESRLKLIASTFVLEWYFDIEEKYKNLHENYNQASKDDFWKSFDSFYLMIENEFWEAHDIIYKDYLKVKTLIRKNPITKILMEISVIIYNLSTFTVYATAMITYFSIWSYLIPHKIFPSWWKLHYAILLLLLAMMLYGIMLVISGWYLTTRNRRTSRLRKKIRTSKERYLTYIKAYFGRRHTPGAHPSFQMNNPPE